MSAAANRHSAPLTRFEQLRFAREVVSSEGRALIDLAARLDTRVLDAAAEIVGCTGCLLVTGIGKAGLIGQKLVATFGSTGTRAHFLHPAEAIHGDLGRVGPNDVVLLLSYSGRSEEIVRLLPGLKRQAKRLVAITASDQSPLAEASDIVLELGSLTEACGLGLAPTTSTTAMLAVGDAVALLVSHLKGFTANDFARFHPGGSLGVKLAKVDEYMRVGEQCRIASETSTVREMLVRAPTSGRRTGAVLLIDEQGKLSGIFTDSDLARLLEQRQDDSLDRPIRCVMTRFPKTAPSGSELREAISVLADYHISELPVVDSHGRPVGLLDVTDIVGLVELPASNPCLPNGK